MRQYDDDDIEVLGGNRKFPKMKSRKGCFIAIGIIVFLMLLSIWIMITSVHYVPEVYEDYEVVPDSTVVAEVTTKAVVPADTVPALPKEYTDSINDVAFTAISLEGCKAAVTFEKPDSTDRDILVAMIAADIRADNGKIVCEFIHDKEQLSRGVRKDGFCYISPEGTVTMGVSEGEAHKQTAIEKGGTFFRQYALVMNGEIQPNILKGKAERRALAIFNGKPTIVISKNRESIYDFSQALADYGFSHAIYLPGGKSFIKMRTDKTDLYYAPDYGNEKYINYLIFKH